MDGNLSTFLSEDLSREALLYHVTIPLRIRPYLPTYFCSSSIYHMKVKVAQLCLTLCDPMDYTVHGVLQARILEWVDFPFSRKSSQPRDQTWVSRVAGGFFTVWDTGEALFIYKTPRNQAESSVFGSPL